MTAKNIKCQDKEWLYEQYVTNNKSTYQIAQEIGCGASTVQHWLKKHNIHLKCGAERILSPEVFDKLNNYDWLYDQYINQFKSATTIGKELGCQQETVSNFLHKFEITIRTQTEAISGEHHPLFGKHHSEETRKKISETNSCHVTTIETRQKLSERMSGSGNPRFGVKLSEDQIARQKASLKQFYDENPSKKNEIREKFLSNRTTRSGEDCNFWKGGISFEPYCPKFNKDLKERVRAFFDFECILCGKPESENCYNLSVHHVEYDKQACCDGKPVQFAALCHRCHSRTNFDRENWEAMIHRIILEVYNGRSYYTKDEYNKIKENLRKYDAKQNRCTVTNGHQNPDSA